jgi:hypothetical protein
MMKRFVLFAIFVAAPWAAASAQAQTCTDVSGKFNEMILPADSAPNDPAGRVLGNVDGTLAGATTAFITSLAPGANGALNVTTNNAFATFEGNLLFTRGAAVWTFISTGFYQVDLTLTVTGGSGKYVGATGTIKVLGIGDSVGPGSGQFIQEYRGQVCR